MQVRWVSLIGWLLLLVVLTACESGAQMVVPTDLPTITPTFTPSPTRTPGANLSPTPRPTQQPQTAGGASATPLLGAASTQLPDNFPTATRAFNPNAPRIEFFTSDPLRVAPGDVVTLFWSARNVTGAVIYRLDSEGIRTQVYNVAADGNLPIDTRSSERGTLRFVLGAGEGSSYVEETISIPLECPVQWFFSPAPENCASGDPTPTRIIDQTLQRGRMIYIVETNRVYTLFNDGSQPGWLSFENRFDPAVHPSREESAPLDWIQPLNELGFVWRGDSDVRNRLGLGLADALEFDGFIQTEPLSGDREILYISGANGVVLQLMPGNEIWQIIGAPR